MSKGKHLERKSSGDILSFLHPYGALVPRAGLEPACPEGHRSSTCRVCLIPPPGHCAKIILTIPSLVNFGKVAYNMVAVEALLEQEKRNSRGAMVLNLVEEIALTPRAERAKLLRGHG